MSPRGQGHRVTNNSQPTKAQVNKCTTVLASPCACDKVFEHCEKDEWEFGIHPLVEFVSTHSDETKNPIYRQFKLSPLKHIRVNIGG